LAPIKTYECHFFIWQILALKIPLGLIPRKRVIVLYVSKLFKKIKKISIRYIKNSSAYSFWKKKNLMIYIKRYPWSDRKKSVLLKKIQSLFIEKKNCHRNNIQGAKLNRSFTIALPTTPIPFFWSFYWLLPIKRSKKRGGGRR